MKAQTKRKTSSGLLAALLATATIPALQATITVDGVRDTVNETEYSQTAVQQTTSNWTEGGQEALANIHAAQDGNALALHLAARVSNRGIILFIDSKAGGRTFIPNNLITYGGEESYINNLGIDASSGMTFESGFTPDFAIRIYGDGGTGAFVNVYDLHTGIRTYAGNAGVGNLTSGIISDMRANNLGTGTTVDSADYSAATEGVEMKLDLAAMGVQPGAQTVKLMAVLVDIDSLYGSNQVLASRTSTAADIGNAINAINFDTEAGTQTLSFNVTGPDSRDVVFSVDMSAEIAKGNFTPGTDKVKVLFFSGAASPTPGEMFLTDDNSDDVYTGTLVVEGTEASSFGTYKFFNTKPGAPNYGYEYGDDRSFNLGPLSVTQILPTVTFRPNSFSIWSGSYSNGESPTQDHDGDGIPNVVEYFMGSNNSGFTPNPQPVSNVVSWPHDPQATGVNFKVLTSQDLSTWTDATASADTTSNPALVKFTLPTATPKLFVRLEVDAP